MTSRDEDRVTRTRRRVGLPDPGRFESLTRYKCTAGVRQASGVVSRRRCVAVSRTYGHLTCCSGGEAKYA